MTKKEMKKTAIENIESYIRLLRFSMDRYDETLEQTDWDYVEEKQDEILTMIKAYRDIELLTRKEAIELAFRSDVVRWDGILNENEIPKRDYIK